VSQHVAFDSGETQPLGIGELKPGADQRHIHAWPRGSGWLFFSISLFSHLLASS
jgi:hypothetical protein